MEWWKSTRSRSSPFDENVYLILDEVPILVDAGMEPESTLRKIKKYIDPQKIEMIVLTLPSDHSSGVVRLKEATGRGVLIHEEEAGSLGDDMATVAYLFGLSAPEVAVDGTLRRGTFSTWGMEAGGDARATRRGDLPLRARPKSSFRGTPSSPRGTSGGPTSSPAATRT